ncbi:hypothetical protein BLNAU_8478 [Blattamonas nauphoetae]|uniref:Right handed beta helix domain-containing protein n=1 Tax=Blattamonas nauphoetae TaxID=2049346 RepID=A0ABQ9XYR9_9EUKA|nr:hypothetical protein BLNAU_8478 [Blattamonas nauphoetae]
MLISLFVVFASIRSAAIDLKDVMNEYDSDVTEIELEDGNYFACDLNLKNRNLSFIGLGNQVYLDVRDCDVAAFVLENASLTLVSFQIVPSTKANFARTRQESVLNLTGCDYRNKEFYFPILNGTDSQLIVNGTRLNDMSFSASIIEGPADTLNPHLSLVVDNSKFTNINITIQKPVLAGPEVQNVTVFNTTFQDIKCTEDGPLPTEPVEAQTTRTVVMDSSHIQDVDGALSGALVFGIQARYLTLSNVRWFRGTNAVRFSENVAFDHSIELSIDSSQFQNTTASELWPNGGFLYLPQDEVSFTMSHTNIYYSSAPNGDGGFMYTKGRSAINIDQCQIQNTSAGKSGGFICAANCERTVSLNLLTVAGSTASEDGGALFLRRVHVFEAHYGGFTECHAYNHGGAMFFEESDNTDIDIRNVAFGENVAESNMGNDVLISYESASNYRVIKKDFYLCSSYTRGNKVTFLPDVRHTEWTNTAWLKIKSIITGVIVGVCVFIAVCIVLTCVCCCCGCCVACGCGKKKQTAYQHVESQPRANYAPTQLYSNHYPPPPAHPAQYPPQQYPQQQYVYAQPVAQPTQYQPYPTLPIIQMGVDQTLTKE